MGVCSAIINFIDGACGTLNVFRNANMEPGYFTGMFCTKKDGKRIVAMNIKSSTKSKASRKKLRAIRKITLMKTKTKRVYFMKLVHFDKAVSV